MPKRKRLSRKGSKPRSSRMKTVSPLQKEISGIENQIKKIAKEIRVLDRAKERDPAYTKAKALYKKTEKERSKSRTVVDSISKRIRGRFYDDADHYPYYTRSSSYGGYGVTTNIHDYVLSKINQHVKISKLTNEQITDIVRKLEDTASQENKSYLAAKKKHMVIDSKHDKASDAYFQFSRIRDEKRDNLSRESHELGTKLYAMKERRDRPKTVEAREKRVVERDKLHDPELVSKIYREFKKR